MGPSAIGASPPHSSFRPPMAKPVVLPAVSNCLICGIGDEPAMMSQFEEVSPRGAASRFAWLAACKTLASREALEAAPRGGMNIQSD